MKIWKFKAILQRFAKFLRGVVHISFKSQGGGGCYKEETTYKSHFTDKGFGVCIKRPISSPRKSDLLT